jgi:acetyl esterase
MTAIDREIQSYIDAIPEDALPRMVGHTPAAAREHLARWRRDDVTDGSGQPTRDVVIDLGGRSLPTRHYPAGDGGERVVLYFHGGGWVIGSVDTYHANALRLCESVGCDVISIEYRLAPEHPFPAAVQDAIDVVDAVGRGADAYREVIVAGDSAGGNLAAVCGLARSVAADGPVVAQLLLYPVLDHDLKRPSYHENGTVLLDRADMEWFWSHYLPRGDDRSARLRSPQVSPLRAPDLSGAPPTVIVVGEHDLLRDEDLEFVDRLLVAGVPIRLLRYAGAVHGFMSFPSSISLTERAWREAGQSLRELLSTPAEGGRS